MVTQENIVMVCYKNMPVYKISSIIFMMLKDRGDEPMIMDGEEIFFIHGLKVVQYPDRSVRIFSDEEQITNTYLLSKLLEDITNMEDCDIAIIPKCYWAKKHTIY